MPDILKPNIIRASAGTGKTYRLSLDYIALLLKLKDQIEFDQILVITFTIKATAEIRQRIIDFLQQIISNSKGAAEIKSNLQQLYPNLEFSPQNIDYLKAVYRKIVTHKSRLNISTLDSFINTIFRSLVAPYHNLNGYSIDPQINDNYLPEIYDHLLTDKNFPLLESIFNTKLSRNISRYDEFIKAIISNRWLFEFYYHADIPEPEIAGAAEESYEILVNIAKEFCRQFDWVYNMFYRNAKSWDKVFSIAWWKALQDIGVLPAEDIAQNVLLPLLKDKSMLIKRFSLMSEAANIWNGSIFMRKKNEEEHKNTMIALQDSLFTAWRTYLFFVLVLPEKHNIIELSKIIYQKYDQIKFREKILTYDDLTTYTWKALYDPRISLISKQDVINLFYEQLSIKIRFILIDEFQDTSIIQWNIFVPLIGELINGSGLDDLGSFTVVGDEKQAIYSWRHGERELLMKMKKLIPADFRTETLNASYRSSISIIDFVNNLFLNEDFKRIIKDANLVWNYDKVKIHKTETGYVKIMISNCNNEDYDHDFREVVKNFLKENYLPNINEKESRPINPADTAILTRTHSELKIVSDVLSELKIDHITETSNSILDHRTIIPILALLRWFHNQDLFSLLVFLRSDAVRLKSAELKKILTCRQETSRQKTSFLEALSKDFSYLSVINTITDLRSRQNSPLELIKSIIRQFNLTKIFGQEADLANFTKFIDLSAAFFASNLEYTHDLGGLLRWCEVSRKSEAFIQASIQQQNVLKILTIHAAKGLEFDTVFFIHKCTQNTAHLPELSVLPNYTDDFSSLQGCMFTCNFRSLLKNSPAQGLLTKQQRRENEEAINIWYVALTRPKRNLFSLITYKRARGLEDYIGSVSNDSPDIDKVMTGALVNSLSPYGNTLGSSFIAETGELLPYKEKEEPDSDVRENLPDISAWFSPPPSDAYILIEDRQQNIPAVDRQKLAEAKIRGNIAHYYLENIKFDSPEARKLAAHRTLAFYGSLVHQSIILQVTDKINDFLKTHAEYFSPALWDTAYCEYSVFDGYGKEYRIDRLLVSHVRKEIMVIDYKTGGIIRKDQISKYNKLLSTIPFVAKNNFLVLEGEFLKIDL